MTTLREAAQQALGALVDAQNHNYALKHKETDDLITALRAALAEPQTTHSADCYKWHHKCAIARIEELREALKAALAEQAQPVQALRWATQLAESLARKHYPEMPQFKPLPDLVGVISQIDNMTCGLTRLPTPQPVQEPYAWMAVGGTIWRHKTAEDDTPLYTAPQAPQPLSGLDVERLLEDVVGSLPVARKLVRAVEAEMLKRMGVGK